jgi:membrane-associated phospholipid phosphatase
MREGDLDAFDQAIERLVDGSRGHVDGLMLAFTRGGDMWPMTLLAAGVFAVLLARGRSRESLYLLLGAGGGLLLNLALKAVFHRARPGVELAFLLPSLSSFSFPSGHTMGTTAVMGSLLVILHVRRARPAIRWLATFSAAAAIVGVGISRIYFGAHYPSDVLAGFLAAAAWVSAVTGWMYPRALPGESTAPGD